ncbi:tripartite tricarboxylate transporter TctB family protein [Serinicoccus kebangsaanensis]|uniref:tripartite tricarboxylate transporter TctB family protein n=1 Tax=Serinicoccus kebangsaanensis TaxID=2602069 RepID=UPI00124EC90C|nr:tripartite tricarboxylate transporter TctB family protein [Serinicoccus kebangsaanensis]
MTDVGFWHGRSGLAVPALLAAFVTYLLVGVLTMEVPEGTDFPGPRFFPIILITAGYLLAALLVLHYLRHPEPVEVGEGEGRWRTFTDWRAVAWCVGGFLVFALTIELLGWIIAAAVLFWCVARGIGSARPLFDASLALLVSSVIYLAFAQGLGLNLPAGFLGGM